MKGQLYKIKDEWFVKYTTYKTIPGIKGVMGSHSRMPESNYIPIHPDHLFYVRDGDQFETVDFEKTQEESGVYNDYKVTWYAKLINEVKSKVKTEDDKENIIKWIAQRIKDEQKKHERNIPDWYEIAARKIYATYDIKLKQN